jgi:hypothetical protein
MGTKNMLKLAVPVYSVDISEEEQKQAQKTRDQFEDLVYKLDAVFDHLEVLNSAFEGVADSAQFGALVKLFHQYRNKTQRLFNEMIQQLELALKELNNTVSDTEMAQIKDTIVGEIREIRDGGIELLDLLEHPTDKKFVQTFKSTVSRVLQRGRALEEVIEDQLFAHIDGDILGRVRLGSTTPLVVKRGFYL